MAFDHPPTSRVSIVTANAWQDIGIPDEDIVMAGALTTSAIISRAFSTLHVTGFHASVIFRATQESRLVSAHCAKVKLWVSISPP